MTSNGAPSAVREWQTLCAEFRIVSAWTLAHMVSFEKFQALDKSDAWMTADEPPMALLFLSHRWDAPDHPDPGDEQLRILQALLRKICVVTRALFADPARRLALVPDLSSEGTLQAEEITRRMLGHGPFSGGNPAGNASRTRIREKVGSLDAESFDQWMLERIGLWVDYCCVPQTPRTPVEQATFVKTLGRLDTLLASSTVVALRREGDDYAQRAWCVSEFWLGARRSFARSLFVDIDRARDDLPVATVASPSANDAGAQAILRQGYESDLETFRETVARWKTTNGPLDHLPPDVWSAYRSLQGSGFLAAAFDPNPARGAIETERAISTEIIQRWWMSDAPAAFDLAEFLGQTMARHELLSTDPTDRIYLALLLLSAGWIEALRPFFRACMKAYLDNRGPLNIEFEPIAPELRAVLGSVKPHSPSVWFSRLSSKTGHGIEEKAAIEALQTGLAVHPPRWKLAGTNF